MICFCLNEERSLQSKFDEFIIYINSKDPKFDIMVLIETCHCESTEILKILCYQGFMNSVHLTESSGVTVFEQIELNLLKHSFQPHLCSDNLSIELETDIGWVILTGVDNSPQNTLKTILEELETFINSNESKSTKMVVGDFNNDTFCQNSISKKFEKLIVSADMKLKGPSCPARETPMCSTCIDHVITTSLLICSNVYIEKCDIVIDMESCLSLEFWG